MRLWSARATNGDTYLAMFNTGGQATEVGIDLAALDLDGTVAVRDLWARSGERARDRTHRAAAARARLRPLSTCAGMIRE
ncbi:hypothetical protein AB5I41_27895 [Sphingomonas sp. MMS24-JH45]